MFHRFDKGHPVPCPEDHTGSDLGVLLRAQLGITAADRDHRVGVFLVQAADHLP